MKLGVITGKERSVYGYVDCPDGGFWEALFEVNGIVSKIDKNQYVVETWRGKHPFIEGHDALFYRATLLNEENAFNWFAECCPAFYRLWNDLKKIFR
jgi:hypothetical protein